MELRDVVDTVRGRRKALTVYAQSVDVADELRDYFASQNVAIHYTHCGFEEPEHVVLSERGEFEIAVSLEAIKALLNDDAPTPVGEDAPYKPVLASLDDTTFSSYDRRQTLYATREVEDRAWRVGVGTLHAGFQTLSTFLEERETYERLARSDLDLHVHGAPDAPEPDIEGVTVHPSNHPDITDTWFAVYDGGPDERQKSALVAEEHADGRFHGVLTYDGDLVDRALAALREHRRSRN